MADMLLSNRVRNIIARLRAKDFKQISIRNILHLSDGQIKLVEMGEELPSLTCRHTISNFLAFDERAKKWLS